MENIRIANAVRCLVKQANDCVKTFLAVINENEQIRSSLKNFPSTPNEIEITLFLVDKTGLEIFHPDISTASATHGELSYNTVDKDNTFVYKSEEIEKYEDALNLVKNGFSEEKANSTKDDGKSMKSMSRNS